MSGVGGPGIDTVRETITRWAPGTENDTGAYVAAVARRLCVKPDDIIDIRRPATLSNVMLGIIIHENDVNPYPPAVLTEGLSRALK